MLGEPGIETKQLKAIYPREGCMNEKSKKYGTDMGYVSVLVPEPSHGRGSGENSPTSEK
jgi:hypothetical protein